MDAHQVFSLYCDELGPRNGENRDREFVAIYEDTSVMLTERDAPRMILIEVGKMLTLGYDGRMETIVNVVDGVLSLTTPEGATVSVVLAKVVERRVVRRATKLGKLVDGLDCGIRLIYFQPGLFNGRPCTTDPGWWLNPVPKRSDPVRYVDLSPYHVSTEESLQALNRELETPVSSEWFRANIVVDWCPAWDEDRWAEIRIGEVVLCFLTTVNPENGVKSAEIQPLKRMREFRLAPEGPLREKHGQAPIFGVNAGLLKPGYIHVVQAVYVRYKSSAF